MRLFVLLLLSLPFLGYTQDYQELYKEKTVDSIQYYKQKLSSMQRQVRDSLVQSEGYKNAIQGLFRHQARTDNYTSFTLFTETLQADFTGFNHQMQNTGFSALKGSVQRFGLGITTKTNRAIIDLYLFTFSLAKKSKKDKESLTSSISNLFQTNFGYDLVKSQLFNVYPYAGISIREAALTYKKPAPESSNPATILELMQHDEHTNANSSKVGYELGLGMDVQISSRQNNRTGTMLFAKIATLGPIGKEFYKINDDRFNPGIKYGPVAVSLGFKFFGRH